MYYIIEHNTIHCNDINVIYYSDDKNQLNDFIINYMKDKKCILIESHKNITNELYNKNPGLYYQYKENIDEKSNDKKINDKKINDKNNINNNKYDNDDKSIVIYERLSSYIPFVNSYQLTKTLYIKKYIPPKISLFRYDANNGIKNNQINNLFGQISSFNLNSLKNRENKLNNNSDEEGQQKDSIREKTFIDELRENVLFNSLRAKMKMDNCNRYSFDDNCHNYSDDNNSKYYESDYDSDEEKIPIIINNDDDDRSDDNNDDSSDDIYSSDWSD
jgi:hypothetical protein